jgi:hypothetical protein
MKCTRCSRRRASVPASVGSERGAEPSSEDRRGAAIRQERRADALPEVASIQPCERGTWELAVLGTKELPKATQADHLAEHQGRQQIDYHNK